MKTQIAGGSTTFLKNHYIGSYYPKIMKYIKGLDTVRAFAIILVILWHWFPRIPINSFTGVVQHVVIPTGEFGVNLFFVLSGYLITSILIKAKAENTDKATILKNFVIRRALRIFPIYYLFTLLLFILTCTLKDFEYPVHKADLACFLTYTTNFLVIRRREWIIYAHTWSLAIEEQFYLIWPVFLLFIRKEWVKHLCLVFIGIAVISVFIYHYVLKIDFDPIFTTCCFDAFGIGGLYAYAQTDAGFLAKFKKYLSRMIPFALTIYLAWKLVPYIGFTPKFNVFSRTIDSIISIWIIDLVVNNRSEWVRKYLLESKVLNMTGKISYGIYLFHTAFPVFYNRFFANNVIALFPASAVFLHNEVVSFILMLLGLYLWCYLSFVIIETNIMKVKDRFNYSRG